MQNARSPVQEHAVKIGDIPQKNLETVCFHALGLIEHNREYLEQHLKKAGTDAETLEALADIRASSVRLERTLGELTALLDCVRTPEPPPLRALELCRLLRELAAAGTEIEAQLGIHLALDCPAEEGCVVRADRDEAEQLILHLLSNALHACARGGRVELSLRRAEERWLLCVADDGCGLSGTSPTADYENRRRFLGGAKAGLMLCREYCRRMGWELTLRPRASGGTEAVVAIPAQAAGAVGASVALHMPEDLETRQHSYRLRQMLGREIALLQK